MTSSKTKNERIREKGRMTREHHSTMDCHVYTLKIDQSKLSTKQKEQLKMMFVEGKRLKNYILSQCMDNQTKLFDYPLPHANEKIQYKDKDGNLLDYELRHLGSQMTQDVLNDMKSNLKTIIKLTKAKKQRHGKLKFCSELKSLSLRQFGVTYKFHGRNKIKIQGVSGKVRVNGAKQFWTNYGVEFANAKLLNKPDGLYVAVTTYKPKEKKETNLIKGGISIDMGCQTTIAYSDGRKENISIGESEYLKTLQRRMQRQVKGSNNRYKTIKNIRKEYQKLENKKNDIINKVIHDLKNYEYVVIQDEQVSKWLKNKYLSKRIHRACLGKLKEKIKNLDNVVVLADDIPTTKICMNCGKVHEMNLSNRTFKCSCGCDMDRDVHAAQNMLNIVNMFNKFMNFVPVGRRDIKRVEFLEAYAKKFKVSYETAKHEAHGLSDRGQFTNLTPHDIKLNDGTIIPKSGMVARVSCEYSDFDECGIADMTYGDVVGLPKKVDESPNYKDSTFYIVSNIVLTALKGSRPNCVAPATGHKDCVRDEKGQIVSVPGFIWF